jgi:hypothetical protein
VFNSEGLHSVSYGGTTFGAPRADHTVISNSLQNSLSAGFVGSSRVSKHSSTYSGYDGYNGSNVTSSTISYSGRSIGINDISTTRGGSIIAIHRSVSAEVLGNSVPLSASISRAAGTGPGGRPGSGATGELDPSFASPVGDVLLPMLLMVGVYAVVRCFKNWRRKLTGKRLFCIK